MFTLQDQSERFFCAWCFLGKPESLRIGCERIIIIAPIVLVGRAALRVAPYAVFQDVIPDEASACITNSWILADSGRIDRPRKSCSFLHRGTGDYTTYLQISSKCWIGMLAKLLKSGDDCIGRGDWI